MIKLPPYGKTLFERIKQGSIPTNDVYLFVGQRAWDKASAFQKSRPGTLCLPPFTCPFAYEWPVQYCDILVFDTGNCDEDYILDLVAALIDDGAKAIRYISPEYKLTSFKKEF